MCKWKQSRQIDTETTEMVEDKGKYRWIRFLESLWQEQESLLIEKNKASNLRIVNYSEEMDNLEILFIASK